MGRSKIKGYGNRACKLKVKQVQLIPGNVDRVSLLSNLEELTEQSQEQGQVNSRWIENRKKSVLAKK
jgi:hypothetical protein